MALRIVRLGSPRTANEGIRIGTVRRPPRGVPKSRYAADDWYDVWLPELSPSQPLVTRWLAAATDAERERCAKRFVTELMRPPAARLLELVAALSRSSDLAIGCYCEDEAKCHRSVLRAVLLERGAKVA